MNREEMIKEIRDTETWKFSNAIEKASCNELWNILRLIRDCNKRVTRSKNSPTVVPTKSSATHQFSLQKRLLKIPE